MMYEYGEGVEQDGQKALHYYEEAANLGDSDAMNKMGKAYDYGDGRNQDCLKARNYYERACHGGHEDSCRHLSSLFRDGNDVQPNEVEANKWAQMATDISLRPFKLNQNKKHPILLTDIFLWMLAGAYSIWVITSISKIQFFKSPFISVFGWIFLTVFFLSCVTVPIGKLIGSWTIWHDIPYEKGKYRHITTPKDEAWTHFKLDLPTTLILTSFWLVSFWGFWG